MRKWRTAAKAALLFRGMTLLLVVKMWSTVVNSESAGQEAKDEGAEDDHQQRGNGSHHLHAAPG